MLTVYLAAFCIATVGVGGHQAKDDQNYGRVVPSLTDDSNSHDLLVRRLRLGNTTSGMPADTVFTSVSKQRALTNQLTSSFTVPDEQQAPDIFRKILRKANGLDGLFDSESSIFRRHYVTLSPEAGELAFSNTSSLSGAQPSPRAASMLYTSSRRSLRTRKKPKATLGWRRTQAAVTTRSAKEAMISPFLSRTRVKTIRRHQVLRQMYTRTTRPVEVPTTRRSFSHIIRNEKSITHSRDIGLYLSEAPHVFREILRKVNSLEGLFDGGGGAFMRHNITLSPEAAERVFRFSSRDTMFLWNTTNLLPTTSTSRDRKVRKKLRTALRTLPAQAVTTTARVVKMTSTSRGTKRAKQIRRHQMQRQRAVRTTRHGQVRTAKRRARQILRKGNTISPNEDVTWYATPSVAHLAKNRKERIQKSHLQLPERVFRRRFGNMRDMEVQMMNAGSPSPFRIPAVDTFYKKAAIYKTPFENSTVELFCLVAYKDAASIVWKIDGHLPEEVISTEVAYTLRNGYKVIVSRLWLPRLEVLPSTDGTCTFHCVSKVDDIDVRSEIGVSGAFNDSCFDNSDCHFRHAICVFGKCECEDFMPVPLHSKHTTCRAVAYIGWPCHYDEQCAYAVQNSVCNVKKCDCRGGYRRGPGNQSCITKNGLGAECKVQSDCDESVCKRGRCRCPGGKSSREGACFSLTSGTLIGMTSKRIHNLAENDSFPNDSGVAANVSLNSLKRLAVASEAQPVRLCRSGFGWEASIHILTLVGLYVYQFIRNTM